MNITVVRTICGANCTIGQLFVDGEHECYTLEDIVRPVGAAKVYGETAIPYGTYEVVITFSNRFQRELPLLVGVPGFDGIRIHPGNQVEDTLGCILVGASHTSNSVINSRLAFNALFPKIQASIAKGEKVSLSIEGSV